MATQQELEAARARLQQLRTGQTSGGTDLERAKARLLEMRSQPPPETPPQAPQAPQGGFGKNLGIGALKGFGSTLASMSSLGERGLAGITKGLGIKPLTETVGAGKTGGELVKESGVVTPQGTAQKIGFGAEQIGEFFLPIPGGKAKAVQKGAGLLKGLGGLAKKSALEGAEFAGRTALQTGGDIEETKKAGIIGAVTPPVLSGLGKVARGATKAFLGKSTGAGEVALKEAFENPNVSKLFRSKEPGQLQEEALNLAKRGLERLRQARSKAYVSKLEGIKKTTDDLSVIKDNALQEIRDQFDNMAITLTKNGRITPKSFDTSAVDQGQNSVKKAYETLRMWKDYTPAGMDRLKKRLDQFRNSVKTTTDGSYALIKTMRDTVDDGLGVLVPRYREMTEGYRTASGLIDEVERTLSLGRGKQKDTATTKLLQTLRQNKEARLDLLRSMPNGDKVVEALSASALSPLAPRGIAGTLFPIGITAQALNPAAWPSLILYVAASSPRLVGELVTLLGKLEKTTKKLPIQRAIEALLIQATRDADSQNESQSESPPLLPPPSSQ